ncbi:hypothetical protein CTKA_01136 [Chthonomonas calidirosea]|uniref:Uncharacterized protein n=1 Tax=Chthonomonas calidirosea (strain DSM 23976 / ICMP 18418 / T49) TaxID=1303518 RepID=S0ES25_CHTCT|nr:hypothetical protein [Chthonomonas calidirosea]CCW33860.1 hypothetical protein CCALI_00020 [Chthonomonas calidirosea T49]CEK16447.1 hypothetical protein CTKA_01136 [Chthonomonas calidirosea]
MEATVSSKTSENNLEPLLWGLRDVTPRPEEVLRKKFPTLPWPQSWISSSVELEKEPVTPFQRPLSTSSITEEITTLFRRLEELKVRVPAPDDVWQYFEKHRRLIEMTRILSELASESLQDAILSLEISRDPEEDEEHVILYARFHNYDETTMKRVRDVRKEFLSSLGEEEEWPLLTTDFRSP